MYKVKAKILYDHILETNPKGLYVWAQPDEQSILKIQRFLRDAEFKKSNTTEYHCTLLYHMGECPKTAIMPEDRALSAVINDIDVWDVKDGSQVIVGRLRSPSIQGIHNYLRRQGFTHTFPEYNPHITFGKGIGSTDDWVRRKKEELASNPLIINFDPRLKASELE